MAAIVRVLSGASSNMSPRLAYRDICWNLTGVNWIVDG
jgi:hypothetical protein